LDSCGSGKEPVAGSSEHGNEPSGSIIGREFLDYLSLLSASQEELCSMDFLVIPRENPKYILIGQIY
jgi:hypothetical protein